MSELHNDKVTSLEEIFEKITKTDTVEKNPIVNKGLDQYSMIGRPASDLSITSGITYGLSKNKEKLVIFTQNPMITDSFIVVTEFSYDKTNVFTIDPFPEKLDRPFTEQEVNIALAGLEDLLKVCQPADIKMPRPM